jgi:hypothetical protein
VRKLGVAAASAALVGTITAVMPAGIAHADIAGTTLPSPIGGLCADAAATDCWRPTGVFDTTNNPFDTLPTVSGNKLILNKESEHDTANAAWFNKPITITGQAIEVSFNAYFDLGAQQPGPGVPAAHGEGLTFSLIEGDNSGLGDNNHPAPVPFNPAVSTAPGDGKTEYGAGGNGLGASGFDGNNDNLDGHKNFSLALLTSGDDDNLGGDVNHDKSRVGLLKGAAWGGTIDPHVRTGRWYGNGALDILPDIYGGRAVPVKLVLIPKPGGPADTWLATVTVDGTVKFSNTEVLLPPTIYFGFTEGTHEFPQRHAISDVSVAYGQEVAPPPPPPPPPPGTGAGAPYTAVPPTRILDTRPNNGVGPDGTKSVKVTGVGGVPANADAVIMNVTATEPTADGFITVYPAGTAKPTASNLNFVAGQNIANLVTAKVGTGGQVNIYNFAGTTHVLFDVVGYFPAGGGATALSASAAQGGEFVPLSPARILDTRSGSGPLGPNSSLDLQVTGSGGVPATGVAAVVMNVTGTNTTAPGFLTAWPTGQTRQTTSTLNFVAGQSVPNLAVVPIGTGGKVSIFNFDGNTDVIADVVGYYTAPGVTVAGGGLFHAMSPLRFLDTRPEADNKTLDDGGTVTSQIVGVAGIPAEAVGVVANVTATNTTVPGFLTVFPAGSAVPGTSSLNFTGHEPGVPNLVMSKLGSGAIDIFNFSPGGTTDAIVDVVGWYGPA